MRAAPRVVARLCAWPVPASVLTLSGAWAQQAAGEWPLATKDYANTRYSDLTEINASNAKNLRLAFTFSTGVLRGHEAAPLMVGNTLYVVTPYPNHLYALDLTKPGAPTKWQFSPKPLAASQGIACCDTVNRGVAFASATAGAHGLGHSRDLGWRPEPWVGLIMWIPARTVYVFAALGIVDCWLRESETRSGASSRSAA